MHKYSPPLSQYLVEPPFSAITAASLFGYFSTSFAYLETAIFAHSSWQNSSSSVRLDGDRLWTAIFKSRHRFSIGLGHSKTLTFFALNHSRVALAVCLRVIVLLEGEPPPQSQVFCRLKQVFFKNCPVFGSIHLALNLDQFPSTCWWKASPQHDAATTVFHCGDNVLRVMCSVGFPPPGPKSSILDSSDQSTFFHMFAVSPTWLVANFKRDFFQQRLSSRHSSCWPDLWSARLIVVLLTYSPTWAVDLSSSSRVTIGLLVASLINPLLARSVSLGGRPSLGRFAVVPYSFPFCKDGFNGAAWGIQGLGYFFYNLTLLSTFPQLYPWPIWWAPWFSWCCLFSNVL